MVIPNQSAILLMDLQHDFLCLETGRMPVDARGAAAVIAAANSVLNKNALTQAIPILILNQFPASDWLGNFFRRGAAIAGSVGARLDTRVEGIGVKTITKSSASAFTNPELDRFLRAEGVHELYVMGVFTEGCVRATVLAARRRGYTVHVITCAVASNARWKTLAGLWAMKRAGAKLITCLPEG